MVTVLFVGSQRRRKSEKRWGRRRKGGRWKRTRVCGAIKERGESR
jgi:hypothetical protein